MSQRRKTIPRIGLFIVLAAIVLLGGRYAATRWLTANFHAVVDGRVYRSAQPSATQIKRWVQDYGLQTIINLRNDEDPQRYANEIRWARNAGVEFIHCALSDRSLPNRFDFLTLISTIETASTPYLIHCRAGADRTGVASVMAAMALGDEPYDQARSQLSYRYLHLDDDPEAVEGVLAKYEAYCHRHGLETGGWTEFRRWGHEHYSPSYYLVEIEAPQRISAQPNQQLVLEVIVHNRSDHLIPAGEPDRLFTVAVYMGTAIDQLVGREFSPRARVSQNIPAESSLSVTKTIKAPAEPGIYEIHFDMVEEHVAWFVSRGSPERPHELVVIAEPAPAPSTTRSR